MQNKQIPADAQDTFNKIKESLKGENYTYESYDVMKVADTDRGKIRVAMKVYVPQAERVTAATNIQEALGEVDITVTVKDETQLDVFIDDLGRKIRLDVKPDSKKGSGGGSEATRIQEGAQCVYTAIRFYRGEIDQVSEEDLEFGMKLVDVPGLKLKEIQGLPKVWKESSMRGADKIIKGITELGRPKEYEFVRGDTSIDDGAIKQAFLRVKKQTNIKSEDKWNPADIWMVKDESKVKQHLDKEVTIDCLNNALQQLRADGKLVGISLKKIEGSPKMALKNADDAKTRRDNEKAKFAKYDLTFDNGRRSDNHPMDVYLYYGEGNFDKFQARNFGGESKGDWKLELKGKSAAQGKIQGKVLRDLISNIVSGSVPKEADWNKCTGNEYDKEIFDLLKKYNAKGFNEETAMEFIADAKQAWKYSKLSGLRLLDWMSNHKKKDQIMKEIYLYASSQSDKSSVYWKLQ